MTETTSATSPLEAGLTFGLGLFTGQATTHGRRPEHHLVGPLARLAEEAGFDAFWVSEHHLFEDGYLPSPLVALAAAASVTERIALGTGIALAPLHDPLRLAEDAATVDQLSSGRLILGLGLGYVNDEFAAFGVERRGRGARLEELVGFLRRAWSGGEVRPPGRDCAVTVTPTPYGGRTIPIWLGGYADAALDRGARIADGHLIGRGDPKLIRATADALTARLGDRRSRFTLAVNLLTVLDEPGLAPDETRRRFLHHQRSYEQVQQHDDPFAGKIDRPQDPPSTADRYLHAVGDAEAVAAALTGHLEPLRGWMHVHLVVRALFPGIDLALEERRLARLAEVVLPAVRAAWTTAKAPENATGLR